MTKLSLPKLKLKIAKCKEPFITEQPSTYIQAMEFLEDFTAFLGKHGWGLEEWRARVAKEYQKDK